MSKFLEILEQHDPANQSKMDAAFQAKFFLYEAEVPFSSKGSQIILHAEQGDIILEAVGMQARKVADAEEDESINASTGTYEVDKTVNDLDSQSWLQTDVKQLGNKRKAGQAAKRRRALLPKVLQAYDAGTKRIEKGLDAVKQSAINRTY
jgi:hypothetical protein